MTIAMPDLRIELLMNLIILIKNINSIYHTFRQQEHLWRICFVTCPLAGNCSKYLVLNRRILFQNDNAVIHELHKVQYIV